MDYKLEDLINIPLFQNLLYKLNVIYSFTSAIVDNDGKILTAVAWQDICTKFHRTNPECEKECIKSDKYIMEHLHEANPSVSYQCPHGLIDSATPIVIDGKHLGNFYIGQFFLEKPDLEFFKKQAKLYGFDEKEYLKSVEKVPIWTKEKLSQYLDFIKEFIEILTSLSLKHLKEIEIKKVLTESEERFRTLFENSTIGIYRTTPDGQILLANPTLIKLLGYSSFEELADRNLEEDGFEPSYERTHFMDIIKREGEVKGLESAWTRMDGTTLFISESARGINDKEGKIIYYDGIIEDITLRKKAEQELIIANKELSSQNEEKEKRAIELIVANKELAYQNKEKEKRAIELIKAKEQAEESDRLKSAFLTNMSHEIRTPMNGILGFTELLREPNLTSDEQQDYIQTIQISGARMLNTINNIVDISKIESGLITDDIKETNVNEKMEFTYKFFKPEVEIKGLQLLFKNGLPSKEAIIKTDNEKVYAILTNLVKNAIKFTYEGSIEFGYKKKGEYLEFYVKDTGVGIPQKQHQMIFERFRQGSESHNRGYEGSGLGLSIAKSYVEMLGGEIWVKSEEGKGSTFYFTIPYNAESVEKATIENMVSTEHKEVEIKKLKILVVEDDEISYSLLTRTLQKISYEVLHAITGVQAIEACRNNPDLDLVLMDIRMPKMDGLEATRQIRQFNKDIIIIAQTAYGFSSDRKKAIEAGCNDYISKPINRTLLYELIKRHCNK